MRNEAGNVSSGVAVGAASCIEAQRSYHVA